MKILDNALHFQKSYDYKGRKVQIQVSVGNSYIMKSIEMQKDKTQSKYIPTKACDVVIYVDDNPYVSESCIPNNELEDKIISFENYVKDEIDNSSTEHKGININLILTKLNFIKITDDI